MIERDNVSTRELREELWSWIAALKPTHTMLQEGMNFLMSWPLKESPPVSPVQTLSTGFHKTLGNVGFPELIRDLSALCAWTKMPQMDFSPKLSGVNPFLGCDLWGPGSLCAAPCS